MGARPLSDAAEVLKSRTYKKLHLIELPPSPSPSPSPSFGDGVVAMRTMFSQVCYQTPQEATVKTAATTTATRQLPPTYPSVSLYMSFHPQRGASASSGSPSPSPSGPAVVTSVDVSPTATAGPTVALPSPLAPCPPTRLTVNSPMAGASNGFGRSAGMSGTSSPLLLSPSALVRRLGSVIDDGASLDRSAPSEALRVDTKVRSTTASSLASYSRVTKTRQCGRSAVMLRLPAVCCLVSCCFCVYRSRAIVPSTRYRTATCRHCL
jgi:hypothetical protein